MSNPCKKVDYSFLLFHRYYFSYLMYKMYLSVLITVLRFPLDLVRSLICLPFNAVSYCQRRIFWRPLKDEVFI